MHLDWFENTIAESYLKICDQKLTAAATNTPPALP
jgi:hypothetical protein